MVPARSDGSKTSSESISVQKIASAICTVTLVASTSTLIHLTRCRRVMDTTRYYTLFSIRSIASEILFLLDFDSILNEE